MNLYFVLGQNVYFLFMLGRGRIFYKCQLGEVVLLLFVSLSSLRIFFLLSLLVTERAVLKSPVVIMDHFLLSVLSVSASYI